jgi:NTP pyrophosphatase (non-canonical NTP hydrolase)
MNFREYQKAALRTWLGKDIEGFYEPMQLTLGIVGEAGEIAEKVKKIYRDQGMQHAKVNDGNRQDLKKEVGDVLWYLAVFCKSVGVDLNDVAVSNIDKLAGRKRRGTLQGSGDHR